MIKNLSIAFMLLFITSASFSQDTTPEGETLEAQAVDPTKGTHYLGLNVGSSTGIGFSYKYTKNRFGFQLSGIPIFTNGEFWASTGIAMTLKSKKSLTSSSKFAPLLYFGAHIITQRHQQYEYLSYEDYYPYEPISSEKVTEITMFSTAFGFGFDYKIDKHFLFNFMTGYGLYYTGDFSTNFAGEIGLHYRL